jgi:hypothetical protein
LVSLRVRNRISARYSIWHLIRSRPSNERKPKHGWTWQLENFTK